MKRILVTIFVIGGLLQTACRKHVPAQPAPSDTNKTDTPKVSDSKYNNAIFDLIRQKEIFRFDTKPDSIQHGVYSWAQFSDSADIDNYKYKVGKVLLNGYDFGSPEYWSPGMWEYNVAWDMNQTPYLLDTPRFEVISPNGVTDLNYATNNQFYYQDTMPRVIKRSQGLTIKVDPSVAPNTDSVWITIDGNAAYMSVTASVMTGSVTLSPAQLAVLVPDNVWRTRIAITLERNHQMTNNGKGFYIGIDRRVYWHVNVE